MAVPGFGRHRRARCASCAFSADRKDTRPDVRHREKSKKKREKKERIKKNKKEETKRRNTGGAHS